MSLSYVRAAASPPSSDAARAATGGGASGDLEQLTPHERAIVGVVAQLRDHAEAAPLAALVRDGGEARERVREALEVLGELDPQLLVRVALEALVRASQPGEQRLARR